MPITLTEKAVHEVRRIIADQREKNPEMPERIFLRMRVVGGGCSGFQNKLDLDLQINDKFDEVFELQGVDIVVDKRSLMYLSDVTVDFIDEGVMRRGFNISNPTAKSTCGCGSSFSM